MAQPRPPGSTSSSMSFPEDIGNIGFYMTFLFSKYSRSSVFGGANPGGASGGGIALPMPDRINDHPSVVWEPTSLTAMGLGATEAAVKAIPGVNSVIEKLGSGVVRAGESAAGLAATVAGAQTGMTINPFLIMLFKQPNYKEFTFSWTLMPRTASESDKLNSIIKQFRQNMLPDISQTSSVLLDYPNIVKPAFHPNDYMFDFKYCAIKDITVDYTGAGMPAFTTTYAPAAVKLEIHLTEIDLWMRSDLM